MNEKVKTVLGKICGSFVPLYIYFLSGVVGRLPKGQSHGLLFHSSKTYINLSCWVKVMRKQTVTQGFTY